MNIIERLNDEEMCIDAIDETIRILEDFDDVLQLIQNLWDDGYGGEYRGTMQKFLVKYDGIYFKNF